MMNLQLPYEFAGGLDYCDLRSPGHTALWWHSSQHSTTSDRWKPWGQKPEIQFKLRQNAEVVQYFAI